MEPVYEIRAKDYSRCLRYIEKYWDKVTCEFTHDRLIHIGLPNKFISPNNGIYKNDQFYWDTYFIIAGLVKCGRAELAKGMVDNFIYLQKRFGIIPMRNRYYNLGGSQIPFLTSMAREIFSVLPDTRWIKKVMKAAEKELQDYWMNASLTEQHLVYKGLSRYCDHFITHHAAEHESGWDMTSRFNDRCLDYLPVDLNCALYKYENDLAEYYCNTDKKKFRHYTGCADERRAAINELMWNKKKAFFFDYDYRHKKQSSFYSIAGFYPLWARLANAEQACKLVAGLVHFEYEGGLANTQAANLLGNYRQHDYPNGWPHQQWIVIKGLLNYGYIMDAHRIAKKFLDLNKKKFLETGRFWEKYNVVQCRVADSERYTTQSGFGWTNAVFLRLIKKFEVN